MDYIQEEFLRQRRALERLMVGGAETAKSEEAAEETAQISAGGGGETAERLALTAAETAAQIHGRTRRVAAAKVRGGARRNGGVPIGGGAVGIAAVERNSVVGQTEKTDARALSRAIQRDARRYDGGFSLY